MQVTDILSYHKLALPLKFQRNQSMVSQSIGPLNIVTTQITQIYNDLIVSLLGKRLLAHVSSPLKKMDVGK